MDLTISHSAIKLLDSFLPSHCALCEQITVSIRGMLCEGCQQDFLDNSAPRCLQCGITLQEIDRDLICGTCLQAQPFFDQTIVSCCYKSPIDHIVLSLKFGHQIALAKLMANQLRDRVIQKFSGTLPDLLCPVPLGAARLIDRGFNQSLEIAKPFASELGIPLSATLLQRVRNTVPQSELHPDARVKNIQHAFIINPFHIESVRGMHIGIVDDVMTTGTTLNEIAKVLKRFGAKKISNFVFSRTPLPK